MQRIANAIQVDCLTRMLTEAKFFSYVKQENNVTCPGEPEAHLVIEKLQDQVSISFSCTFLFLKFLIPSNHSQFSATFFHFVVFTF